MARTFAVYILGLCLSAVLAAPGMAPRLKVSPEVRAPNTYLVSCDDVAALQGFVASTGVLRAHGVEVGRTLKELNLVEVKAVSSLAVEKLRESPHVNAVYEARIWTVPKVIRPQNKYPYPLDEMISYYTYPWGLDRINQEGLPLDNVTTQMAPHGEGVDVYVVDTGVFIEHFQFRGRASWYHVSGNFKKLDDDGHGTHVAGTIAGSMTGVAVDSHIYAVKVLGGPDGSGSDADVLEGLLSVLQRPNKKRRAVINMSLGMDGHYNGIMENIARLLDEDGVILVAAAGNYNKDACGYSPAYLPQFITVGATDWHDRAANFSNWGKCVDVYAPGYGILSGVPFPAFTSDKPVPLEYHIKDFYNSISGTSILRGYVGRAAPHVAGAAALYLSRFPQASPPEVKRAIVGGARQHIVDYTWQPAAAKETPRKNLLNTNFKAHCRTARKNKVTTSWCKAHGCPTEDGRCKWVSKYAPRKKTDSPPAGML